MGGDVLRLDHIVGRQQSRTKVGLTNPPARIDPRPQQEPEVIRCRHRVHARHIGKRDKAGSQTLGHNGEPLAHEGPIDPDKRGHIRHGRKRNEVEHIHKVGALDVVRTQSAVCLNQQQENDTRRA